MAAIESGLKDAEAAYANAIREWQAKELKVLRRKTLSGSGLAVLNGPDLFEHRGELRKRLTGILTGVRRFGEEQVRQEMKRQK